MSLLALLGVKENDGIKPYSTEINKEDLPYLSANNKFPQNT